MNVLLLRRLWLQAFAVVGCQQVPLRGSAQPSTEGLQPLVCGRLPPVMGAAIDPEQPFANYRMARASKLITGQIYECNRTNDRVEEKLYSLLVGRVHIPLVMHF